MIKQNSSNMYLVNSYNVPPSQISEEDQDSQGRTTYAQDYQDYMRQKENEENS